jgi:hypothetical protein
MSPMRVRPSTLALTLLAFAAAAFALTLLDAALPRAQREAESAQTGALVARLGLTDLALFTEARYTRHPTQADLHSAFQDHPLALEHFPTGSLVPPPRHETVAREAALPD